MTKHQTDGDSQGTLVIIGGHGDHDWDRVILKQVAKLINNGRLVLATIASHEPTEYLEQYRGSFGDLGITEVTVLHLEDRRGDAAKRHRRSMACRPRSFRVATNCVLQVRSETRS